MHGWRLMVKTKRVYDGPSPQDGYRVLVDAVWPRGLTKQKAKVDVWLKDLGVSSDLRKWFAHDPRKWLQFKQRFYAELESKQETMARLSEIIDDHRTVTLLYGSRERTLNNAAALQEYIASKQRPHATHRS